MAIALLHGPLIKSLPIPALKSLLPLKYKKCPTKPFLIPQLAIVHYLLSSPIQTYSKKKLYLLLFLNSHLLNLLQYGYYSKISDETSLNYQRANVSATVTQNFPSSGLLHGLLFLLKSWSSPDFYTHSTDLFNSTDFYYIHPSSKF